MWWPALTISAPRSPLAASAVTGMQLQLPVLRQDSDSEEEQLDRTLMLPPALSLPARALLAVRRWRLQVVAAVMLAMLLLLLLLTASSLPPLSRPPLLPLQRTMTTSSISRASSGNVSTASLPSSTAAAAQAFFSSPTPASAHRALCEQRYPHQQHGRLREEAMRLMLRSSSSSSSSLSSPPSFFIALNLHDNAAIVVDVLTELTRLVHALCLPVASSPASSPCGNVHLSVYESGSTDGTVAALSLFALLLSSLSVPHTLVTGGELQRRSGDYRIDHLAAVRNAALQPLYAANRQANSSSPFSLIIFLNDAVHCAEDVLALLALALPSSPSSPPPHIACGLDFDDPAGSHSPGFYDTWVMRGRDGSRVQKQRPYFSRQSQREERRRLEAGLPVPVFCCWNGLVVLQADDWWRYGLRFRAHDDTAAGSSCEASECSHVCEDYAAIHGQAVRVLVDPLVHVAYEPAVYADIHRQPWFAPHPAVGEAAQGEAAAARVNSSRDSEKGGAVLGSLQWECCDLAGKCGMHEVRMWSEEEKQEKRRQARAM